MIPALCKRLRLLKVRSDSTDCCKKGNKTFRRTQRPIKAESVLLQHRWFIFPAYKFTHREKRDARQPVTECEEQEDRLLLLNQRQGYCKNEVSGC